jgi:pimeloyl-ACP methyl ester carboxylesterase
MQPTTHWAHTRDGMKLALYNYRPATLAPDRMPVFLCHGMGSNRCDLDYPGTKTELSLAKYLVARGHDVWIVELRGAGRSTKPGLFSRLRYDWTLDDYVVHDIPAAVMKVLELTGRPSVHWIGHSMGGMLAYPFLATSDPQLVRSCIAVGAPALAVLSSRMHDLAMKGVWLLDYVPFLPWGLSGRFIAPLIKYLRKPMEKAVGAFFYNPVNMSDEALACLLKNAIENLPPSLIKQLAEAYKSKHHRNYYGTFSIRDNLHRIETPLLVIAGSVDGLTPAEDLKFVFDHVSSKDKEFVIVGRASGASEEYSHVDLILGTNAHHDVFPIVEAWIERHDRAGLSEPEAEAVERDREVEALERSEAAAPAKKKRGEILEDPRLRSDRAAG